MEQYAVHTVDRAQAASTRQRQLASLAIIVIAILAYPLLLDQLHSLAEIVGTADSDQGHPVAWIEIAALFAVILLCPLVAFMIASQDVGAQGTAEALLVRRAAHFLFAAPPLYTATGVYLLIFGISDRDETTWMVGWLVIFSYLAVRLLVIKGNNTGATKKVMLSPRLRFVHGICAALLVLFFLGGHIANHLAALFGNDVHRTVMDLLRLWYRSPIVQPMLIAGFIFMIGSGLYLARFRTAVNIDRFDTLQTLSGAFLAAFLTSHLAAVLILARWQSGTDTNWLYAINAPVGLFHDAWSIRLIPHYGFAIWALITHAGCGARTVLLGHQVSKRRANVVAMSISIAGAVVAITVVMAMLGVRIIG